MVDPPVRPRHEKRRDGGGREGVEPPNVHAMWGPAEVAHRMTNRPTFRVNRQVPAGDIPAAMAAAMAASAMVIRDHAPALRTKKGYTDFDAAAIALFYSPFIEQSPKLSGNTWWKGDLTNAQLGALFEAEARRPVDYALGANPYRRSYLVGFGAQPFNNVHHRGAIGAWAGFDHFIPGKADDRGTCRHVLYGALVAGPDHNDVFLCGNERRLWLPAPDGKGHGFFYRFPNRPELVYEAGRLVGGDEPPRT